MTTKKKFYEDIDGDIAPTVVEVVWEGEFEVIEPREHEGKSMLLLMTNNPVVNGEPFEGDFQDPKKGAGASLRLQSWDSRPDTFGIPVEDRHKLLNLLKNRRIKITIEAEIQ